QLIVHIDLRATKIAAPKGRDYSGSEMRRSREWATYRTIIPFSGKFEQGEHTKIKLRHVSIGKPIIHRIGGSYASPDRRVRRWSCVSRSLWRKPRRSDRSASRGRLKAAEATNIHAETIGADVPVPKSYTDHQVFEIASVA